VSTPLDATDVPTLVVVAHVDDDGVGFAGGLRDRRQHAAIAYLTDSAPRDPQFFTTPAPSRAAYAAARRAEACHAGELLGIPEQSLFFLDAPDMESYRELARLERELQGLADALRPHVLWSLAYDGGHPDHDVAAFLATRLAARLGVPHCEFALYRYRRQFQLFRFAGGEAGAERRLGADQQSFKRRLLDVYASQAPLLARIPCDRERYRLAHRHDFLRPPATPTLYESWGWPVTAEMLVDAFRALA
jgi:LmbE family N-acetylglucosaminyl deacetylase